MSFHNFIKKTTRLGFSLAISIMVLTLGLGSFVDSRGYTHIDKEQPYKSFVGKILSTGNGESHGRGLGIGRTSNKHKASESQSHSSNSQKSSHWNPLKTKGRGVGGDDDKPNWYFSDPMTMLGKAVMGYEPSDPNEPGPSAKTKVSGGSSAKNPSPSSSSSEPGSPKDSSSSTADSSKLSPTGNIRVVQFDGDEVDPDAPGWFALKLNTDFGTKLSLGTLLRKKGHGKRKNETSIIEGLGEEDDGNNNDTSEFMSPLLRRYDKACLHLEYIDAKAAVVAPVIPEVVRDKIRSQNQVLADFFLDMVTKTDISEFVKDPVNKQEPLRGFEILDKTKEIFFNYICKDKEFDEVDAEANYNEEKDKLLPKGFVEVVYSLFLKLHSITRSSETKDYIEPQELVWIMSYLEKCNQTGGQPKKIQWFTDECKETVLAFDQDNNFACTPFLEFDFNVRKYDPILDFVWHMITSVHSHCFESFQTNTRMWHRYALAMADLFPPEMRLRWSSSNEDPKKFYTRLLGPHYEVYFENMNRCMYAANLRSNVPYLMPRFEGDRKTRYSPAKYMTF